MTTIATAFVLAIGTASFAATIDGKVTASDGYTQMSDLSFTIDGGSGGTLDGGKLWQKVEGNMLFFAFRVPTAYVDNSYGLNTAGWGPQEVKKGKKNKPDTLKSPHAFDKLLGSDHVEFTVFGDDGSAMGTSLVTFKIDYIAEIDDGAAYKSAGVLDKGENHPTGGEITNKADGSKVDPF